MMKIVIETNKGTFAAYLNRKGEIDLYEGDDEVPVAKVPPILKRGPVLDVSTDGVATAASLWLESNYDRLEISRVVAHLLQPGI
jgi:hypothetical protein